MEPRRTRLARVRYRPDGTCRTAPRTDIDRRAVSTVDGLYCIGAGSGAACELLVRGVPRGLRGQGARPFVPMCGGIVDCVYFDRRQYIGMHEYPR